MPPSRSIHDVLAAALAPTINVHGAARVRDALREYLDNPPPDVRGLDLSEIEDATEWLRSRVHKGRFDVLAHPAVPWDRSPKAGDALQTLSQWTKERPLPEKAEWPQEVPEKATLYLRHALHLELQARKPHLFTPHWELKPTLKGLAEDVLPSVKRHIHDSASRDLFLRMVRCCAWSQMAQYQIFNTPRSRLLELRASILELRGLVTSAAAELKGDAPFGQGTLALLALSLGRVGRALGGEYLEEAERNLTDALELYEQRVISREGGKVQSPEDAEIEVPGVLPDKDLAFSMSRSSTVLLQLAYLHLLNGRCLEANAQLRTAWLLARGVGDTVLESEIRLVDLTSRRLGLRQADVATLGGLRDQLTKAENRNEHPSRRSYQNMARFQKALCDAYDGGTAWSKIASDIREKTTWSADHERAKGYWTVSSYLLEARILLSQVRNSTEYEVRQRAAADARGKANQARAAIENERSKAGKAGSPADAESAESPDAELAHLWLDHKVYLAEAKLCEGDFKGALEDLRNLRTQARIPTSGYTTLPCVRSFIELLRIDAWQRVGAWRSAERRRSRFLVRHKPSLQVGWIEDYYNLLTKRFEGQRYLSFVSRADLEASLANWESHLQHEPVAGSRQEANLIGRVVKLLYQEATERRGGVRPLVPEFAQLCGVADERNLKFLLKLAEIETHAGRRSKKESQRSVRG